MLSKANLISAILFLPTACTSGFAQSNVDSAATSHSVVLEIDGTKLTLADLEQKRPVALFQARNNFYQAERKVVDEFVDEYLLERQAEKEKSTVDQLLKVHVTDTVAKDPAEEALRVYYEGVDTTEPYEAVRGQIIESVRQRRIAKAKSAYLQSLRRQSNVAIRLGPPRAQVPLKDTPVRGVPDAPVMLVEFADYECSYCQQAQPALDKLQAEFKEKLAFAYKDAPLPMHPQAQKAAEAARCAGVQGKYWEYHDLLYTTKQLDAPKLKEYARQLQLDGTGFNKCLDSGEQSEIVKAQLATAQSLGLQGTPSFFVNGRFFSGALSYEALRRVVEEELAGLAAQPKDIARR